MLPLIILALVALLVGSLTDLKTREVPDWVSFGLIFAAFGLRIILALSEQNINILLEGVYGFLIFLGLSYALFYLGQFGGGDAKVLMGLGAAIGFLPSFDHFFIKFLIALIVAGAVYGMLWSIYLAIKNWKRFLTHWRKLNHQKSIHRSKILLFFFTITIVGIVLIRNDNQSTLPLLMLAAALNAISYMWIFVKTIEQSVMLKKISPEKLTEGDWIAEEIKIGKFICSPKDLGVSKEQIKKLIALKKQNKIKEVLIKEGIPFIPSFLLAYVGALVFPIVV